MTKNLEKVAVHGKRPRYVTLDEVVGIGEALMRFLVGRGKSPVHVRDFLTKGAGRVKMDPRATQSHCARDYSPRYLAINHGAIP